MNKKNHRGLVFLYDRTMIPKYQELLKLNMVFLSYGYIRGKLYEYYDQKDFHPIAIDINDITLPWGNDKVYGALFSMPYFNDKVRALDSLFACSLSRIGINHKYDICHRHTVKFTPIYFNSLEELAYLRYNRGEDILADTYYGNPINPYIIHRVKRKRYRINDGIDAKSFYQLYNEMEECNG